MVCNRLLIYEVSFPSWSPFRLNKIISKIILKPNKYYSTLF